MGCDGKPIYPTGREPRIGRAAVSGVAVATGCDGNINFPTGREPRIGRAAVSGVAAATSALIDRQLYDLADIVGLDRRLVRRLVSADSAAFAAFAYDDIPLFRVGKRAYRLKETSAIRCAVPGIYINMKRKKAERAMISRGVAERLHLFFAVSTDKSAVVFLKSFIRHRYLLLFELINTLVKK